MALATYSDLKSSAADWLNRADLTAQIADFVTLGEARMNRVLRVVQMETRDTGTSPDSRVAVPTDWLETRTLRLANPTIGQQLLEYVGEEEFDDLETRGLTGNTRYYTIINGEFQLLPAPSGSVNYVLRYYAKIPALSDTNTTNWLLSKSPDLYLYSTLLGAEAYLKNDERLTIWGAAQQTILQEMQSESERAKRSTTRLVAKRATFG
jgi:hypothetical protein